MDGGISHSEGESEFQTNGERKATDLKKAMEIESCGDRGGVV